jgi:hydroxymethylpyrimidine pyrophosphatase-like HAD family hydrolase
MADDAPADILLISTDFDGTLIEHGNPAPFAPLLMEVLGGLRQRGVKWAINTGRTLHSLIEGLDTFALPLLPDFALTSEREIFRPASNGSGGWEDFSDWNVRCDRAHRELFDRAAPLLREAVAFLEKQTGARALYDHHARGREGQPELAGLVARDGEQMDEIVAFLDALAQREPQLGYQRNSIYLRFCHVDYHKGATLAELGRLTRVPTESIFAVGDHHNDIPMLDGKHAGRVACPANSIEAVKEIVSSAGGYVASADYSAGVLEALQYYCKL